MGSKSILNLELNKDLNIENNLSLFISSRRKIEP